MIDVALQFLVSSLNEYLVARTGATFGNAELGRLIDDSGKSSIKEDHLGVALLNVAEETVLKSQIPQSSFVNGMQVTLEPELLVSLQVLVAASFRQYPQALRQLSLVLTFFQSHRTFDSASYPALDPRIAKLNLELETLGYEQLNQIWTFVGGKQLPSAVFRVRMVALQDQEPVSVGPPIQIINSDLHSR